MSEPKTGAEWLDATCHDTAAFTKVVLGIFSRPEEPDYTQTHDYCWDDCEGDEEMDEQ